MFRDEPGVHIIGHWTYPSGVQKAVYVASNADDVELFVNGRSLGQGTRSDRFLFTFASVSWEAGEIRAVASSNGKVVATQVKRSAGPAVALRLTPITAPGGLRADGSDVALLDVEAVDAQGQRCPTVEPRVDFRVSGPAVWRGGYNSGKIDSTNNSFLDLEAGINRVALRAQRTAGEITVSASSPGLEPASLKLTSVPFPAEGGASSAPTMPAMTAVRLPARGPEPVEDVGPRLASPGGGAVARGMLGRFTKAFNYSGPSSYIVHVETQARDGKNIYVDAANPFEGLPEELAGADWVQAASREALYDAVDLMELSVTGGSTVWIAHDDRLPRPPWLTRTFAPTNLSLAAGGYRMTLFRRDVPQDQSLTLGANAVAPAPSANMYIVFIQGQGVGR